MSDLSRTLTEAAADAVAIVQCEHHEEREYHWHRTDGVAAAVAVLTVLADHFEGLDESDCHPSDTLRRLAGEITDGEPGPAERWLISVRRAAQDRARRVGREMFGESDV